MSQRSFIRSHRQNRILYFRTDWGSRRFAREIQEEEEEEEEGGERRGYGGALWREEVKESSYDT